MQRLLLLISLFGIGRLQAQDLHVTDSIAPLNGSADSTVSDYSRPLIPMVSLSGEYHYQGFHGTEAAVHFTYYNYAARNFNEFGLFLGADFNFQHTFNTCAPTFGIETEWLFDKWNGWGFGAKLHGTLYTQNRVSYLIVAPEISANFLSFLELFYSYNYTEHAFAQWQPHRFGMRITVGYPRTAINIIEMSGGM